MLLFLHELTLFLNANWIFLILVSLPTIYWYGTRNYNFWAKKGIPSPRGIPFLGSFYRIGTPTPLLHGSYIRKYGKVVGTFNGQKPILLISDPKLIQRIFVTDFHRIRNRPESSARHYIFGQNLVAANGEMWKRQRSILNPMFSPVKLRRMEDMMAYCVNSMIEALEEIARTGKNLDVRECMGNFTVDIIAKCAFGTDTNAHKNENNPFVTAAYNFFDFRLARFIFMSLVPRWIQRILVDYKVKPLFIEEFDFFENFCRAMIAKRKADTRAGIKHHDILQLMLNAEDADAEAEGAENGMISEEAEAQAKEFKNIIGSKYLTEEEVMAQAMIFFLAGYETTANTLSYVMYELCVNPDIQERLYQEIQAAKVKDPALTYATLSKLEYMDAVICEVLRKYCPASSINREANTDYYIPEYDLKIEKGTFISVPIYVNHNSEEYWDQPEKFDPERFMGSNREKILPYSYMPFSAGPRLCIGMRLSLTESKMGLAQMMDRFEFVKTPKTFEKLEVKQCMFLLKTSPIFVGVKKRE